jgi:RHS repeat-associated protein
VGSTYQLYFGTPMGGIPSQRIPVTLPNDVGGEPGDVINVWYFDGSPMGGTGDWKIAGQAVVSADGKTVKMPNGQGIPRFCGVCGLTCLERQQSAAPDKAPNNRKCSGNPVDLSNGQEMPATGGLSCSGLTPINTGMSYNPVDAFNSIAGVAGSLGIGWTLDYDIVFLPFSGTQKRLVMPGNNRVNFADDGSGVYRSVDDPRFDGAEIRALSGLGNEWELKFRDGRAWRFKSFSTALARGAAPTFVTEIADAQGNVLPIDRRPDGRINSVGSGERGVTMSYGSNGFVAQISDTAGRTMSYSYTPSNRLSTVTDADGRVTSYTYVDDSEFAVPGFCGAFASSGERLKTITYPGRPTPTANFYGPGRRVLRQTGYDGREFRFAYKVTGACVTHVSTPGVKCTANCPQVDSWENFEAGWRIYGGAVIATTVTQPNGQTTSAEFNSRGSATAEFDPSGQKTDSKLDARNRVTVRTDALGRASKYVYDAKGNITQTTDPLGRITNVTYHAVWNKPTSITRFDEANQPQTWSFTYDAAKGTLLTATNPLNQTATFAYTARGQIERVTDALNHSTSFEHNAAGDLTKTIDALLNETHFSTDGVGRRIATTDPLSNITRNTYNGGNRVTSVTDAKSQQTNFDYDPAGRLAAVTNARHSTVESYTYDTGDRVTTRSDAKAKQTLYQYDSSTGRLSGVTDRKGQVTTYAYDEQNRVVAVTRADGITRFSYDAAGRLAEVADPRGTISYVYDPVDRMVRETQAVGGVTSVIEYGYDALDRRSSRTLVGVIGEVTTYGYDAANKLISIAYRGQITTLEYDAAGRLAKRVLPNDIRQEFAYDDADRLLSIAYSNPDGTLVEQITYGYDGAGRRVNETKSTHPLPDTTFTAMYDEADRMATIAFTATGQSFTLSYDDNGNLIEKRDAANPSYVTTYGWDSRNRLTSIVGPGLLASFEYDALGRRISRTVNGVTTRYLYDGVQALGEIVNGEQTALLTTPNVDEIIARYTAQGVRVFLIDALNTVLAQTKDDRSAQNYYAYSPYGEATALGSDDGNAVQYTARENDQTGLYYNRARYYDPLLKRFISEDPIGLNGGMNVYAYAGGNPISGFDPFGLYCTSAGGMTTCVFPGGPEFKVPTPDGFPASLGPGPRQLSHRYDVQRGIGCADSNDVMQGLIDNPTPGNPSPATPGGTANNARVFGQDNPVTSYLTQDLRTGAPLVVNITGPGSLFPHGYVARTVTDGIAHTYGEGLNWKQSPAQTFQWVQDLGNNYVWGQQMDDIIGNAGGSKCSCRGW